MHHLDHPGNHVLDEPSPQATLGKAHCPYSHTSLENCRECHEVGQEGVPLLSQDHVGPGLPRNVPTIYVLFSTLFQDRVSHFWSPHPRVPEPIDYLGKYEN